MFSSLEEEMSVPSLATDLKKKINKNGISFLLKRDPIPLRSEGDHKCDKGESSVWTLMGCNELAADNTFAVPAKYSAVRNMSSDHSSGLQKAI